MIFDEAVKKAVEETKGGLAALIMARDGISLSQYVRPEASLDLEILGIEYASLLEEVKKHAAAMNAGEIKEITLATDRLLTVVRWLNSEYFMALIMERDGNAGKGRFLLRVSAPSILKEL